MNRAGTCKHFTGVQHGKCAVGVVYRSTLPEKVSLLRNLPCFREGVGKCDRFEAPTAEEVAADEAEIWRILAAIDGGKSPCCGADLTKALGPGGTGSRFCTKCKAFVVRGCNPSEGGP